MKRNFCEWIFSRSFIIWNEILNNFCMVSCKTGRIRESGTSRNSQLSCKTGIKTVRGICSSKCYQKLVFEDFLDILYNFLLFILYFHLQLAIAHQILLKIDLSDVYIWRSWYLAKKWILDYRGPTGYFLGEYCGQ